jgi:hypothetical protein
MTKRNKKGRFTLYLVTIALAGFIMATLLSNRTIKEEEPIEEEETKTIDTFSSAQIIESNKITSKLGITIAPGILKVTGENQNEIGKIALNNPTLTFSTTLTTTIQDYRGNQEGWNTSLNISPFTAINTSSLNNNNPLTPTISTTTTYNGNLNNTEKNVSTCKIAITVTSAGNKNTANFDIKNNTDENCNQTTVNNATVTNTNGTLFISNANITLSLLDGNYANNDTFHYELGIISHKACTIKPDSVTGVNNSNSNSIIKKSIELLSGTEILSNTISLFESLMPHGTGLFTATSTLNCTTEEHPMIGNYKATATYSIL